MYSVVLMMAMTTGGDVIDGRRGGGGCCGCYGGGYGGCYGGCYGGGGRGGRRGGRRGGGGCCGCYGGGYGGCYGGYYGGCMGMGYGGCMGMGYGGCYGGFGYGCIGYGGGCYGGVGGTLYGHPMQGGAEQLKKKPAEGKKGTQAGPASATIVVQLPAEAKLRIDDEPTTSTGDSRVLVSPALNPDREYHYTLTAEVVREGKPVKVEKVIAVRAGETTPVTLTLPATTVAQR